MEKILITGINGFAASHLARELCKKNEVHGTVRVRSDLSRIEDIKSELTLHLVELTDAHSIYKVISDVMPDQIYHLAAQSYVRSSWDSPNETMAINYEGTVNLLEAVKKVRKEDGTGYQPSILITSTSETYGHHEGWINENTIQKPNTPYGISKLAQEQIALCYQAAFNMKIKITRAFNITGPGRADVFVDSNFAKQIVEIEKGLRKEIKHGNLESARDFVDVHDIIKGYIKVMKEGTEGNIYCLASGKPQTIQKLLNTMKELSTAKEIPTSIDTDRMRPVDTPTMKGNSNKIRKELNWLPERTFVQSCEDLLNYWRNKL